MRYTGSMAATQTQLPTHTLVVRFDDPDTGRPWQCTYGRGCWTADGMGSPNFDHVLAGNTPDADEMLDILSEIEDFEGSDATQYQLDGGPWVTVPSVDTGRWARLTA